MSRSIRCLVIVATFTIVLIDPPQSRAGEMVFNPTPNPNMVFLTMRDAEGSGFSNVTIVMQGVISQNEVWALPVVKTPDGFWSFGFTLSLNATLNDEINLVRSLQHVTQPHPGIDNGLGGSYNPVAISINAQNFKDGENTINLPVVFTMHGAHNDVFFNERLTFTVAQGLFINDIITWQYTLEARHVPEPATLLLLGTGLTGVVFKARKRFKTRKEARGSK